MRGKLSAEGTSKITLAELAKHLKLTKGTVSAVLNDSPYAKAIPRHTKERIVKAARDLNYRPNFFASTLRKKRTYTVGVIAEEIGDPYGSMLISGIESALSEHHYFFLTVVHRHDPRLLKQYSDVLRARGVEGIITVDTILDKEPSLPTVAIAGNHDLANVTNIALDHTRAAQVALRHLAELGHRKIAVIRGQPSSSDSQPRWKAICETAEELGITIPPEATAELLEHDPSPSPGYRAAKELLARTRDFTALFSYNDLSGIGAIRAFRELGIRVPEDVSVIGFDDIREAAYQHPSLTTVRQPLREMGEMAGHAIVDRIEGRKESPSRIAIEPELVVRESTGPARVSN